MVILRAFLALAAGFATTAVLVAAPAALLKRLTPRWAGAENRAALSYFLASLGGSFVAGAAGGYVAAWAAAENPLTHALALGIVVLVLGALGALQTRGRQPLWQQLTLLALTPAGVVAGGLLRLKVLGIL